MAKPVIFKNQSVPGFLQWQAFELQFAATGNPTAWHCTRLAPGLFFDDETGTILGAATLPGVYSFALVAENADGASDPELFTMGIEASGFVQPANVLDLTIDVTTRRVSVAAIVADAGTAGASANAKVDDDDKLEPLFWAKAGDDLVMSVRFTKGGVQFDPKLTGLKFALKEFEPEGEVAATYFAGGDWVKSGAGDQTTYLIICRLTAPELVAALTNYEEDKGTRFLALGEFEWLGQNTLNPQIGPANLRGSSRTFGVMLPRDIIANA